ncbi:MAG: transcriptional repressor [Pelagibacterales bacterium]|jgi:Fur family transcriptional regulator, ferric uptake regulator|nr:transcriptional repressor [Pelagibacterales bacterium]
MKLKHPILNSKLILSKNDISRTKFRTDLLNLFYTSKKSVSIEDVLKHFDYSINKVTVYRSLESFENKGLIHKVPDSNNLKRYSLCREEECSPSTHNHNHGHFICYDCNQTFCMQEIKFPDIKSVKGFYIQELKLTLEGYCQDCYTN